MLSEFERPGDADDVARKVRAGFEAPLFIDGRELRVTASIGISLFPQDGDSAGAMLRQADSAMYRAKTDGAGQSRHSSPHVNIRALPIPPAGGGATRKVLSWEPAAGTSQQPDGKHYAG